MMTKKAKSDVWKNFIKESLSSARCVCTKVLRYGGNTINLHNHLKNIHKLHIATKSSPKYTKLQCSDSQSKEQIVSKDIEENKRECFEKIDSSKSLNKNFVEPTKLKNVIPEIVACIIAASFHITLGLTMAYSATLIPHLEKKDAKLYATKEQTSWIVSLDVISTPFGNVLGGLLMETLGPLWTLQIGAIPGVIGWVLIASAINIPMLCVGRLFSGLSTALGTSPAIVYITEVARPEIRDSLISIAPTLASLGMLLSYLKGAYLNWRMVAWINIIYSIVPVIMIQIWVPESPIWLVSKGRINEAKKSLKWLYKNEKSQDKTSMIETQFSSIMKENEIKLNEQRRNKHGSAFNKLRGFLKPTGWKPMTILFFLFSFQQFSGIYITTFYAVTWFQEVGADLDEYLATILVGLTRFLSSVVNIWVLKRYKRRTTCIISSIGMAICMTVSGYFTFNIKNGDHSGYWVPVACLLLYVSASMFGMLSVPWIITAELFPTEIRGIAQSISYSMAYMLMFAALQSYRSLQDFLGGMRYSILYDHYVYVVGKWLIAIQWFFAGVSAGATLFVWLMLPETHGKKLSEIEEYFHSNFLALGAKANHKKQTKERVQQEIGSSEAEPLNPKAVQNV